MRFLKKLFGSKKKEEKKVDDEIINEPTQTRNFKYLDDLIYSGVKEIVLDSDIVLESDEESYYEEGIKLDVDDLVIDGNGYAISAEGKTRIFEVTGKNIIIKNITLKNGFTKDRGGAIYCEGEMIVSGSTLQENTANVGGAIFNQGILTITKSTFTRNLAQKSLNGGCGGAIYSEGEMGSKLHKSTLVFKDMEKVEGGESCYYKSGLTIRKSTFSGNTAEHDGGAIYNSGVLGIIESVLNENESSHGAAIMNDDGRVILEKSSLTGNTANWGGAIYDESVGSKLHKSTLVFKVMEKEEGGELCYYKSGLTIRKSTFSGNTAEDNGGAIFNDGSSRNPDSNAVIYDINESTFEGNIAQDGKGGAISNGNFSFSGHDKSKLIISESTFTGNISKGGGGAIWNFSGMLTVSDSTLAGNTAARGGAIYNDEVDMVIERSTFTENRAQTHDFSDGGAIYNMGKLTISKTVLIGNTAEGDGGAIQNRGGNIFIEKSELTENMAIGRYYGGGAISNLGYFSIIDSKFNGNISKKDGGAISSRFNTFKVFNCVFLNNKSPISIIFNLAYLEVFNSCFIGNNAKIVIVNDKRVSAEGYSSSGIFNGEFKKNNVSECVIFHNGKSCTIERTIFENNSSTTIVNKGDLTLISPEIKDAGKTIFNKKYIFIKKSSTGLENKIYGRGIVEDESIIPQYEKFDFGYLDNIILKSTTNEIILDEDITFENYEREYYEGGIELDADNLIIDGNGHTIDASGKTRIFYCTGKNITLKNITFKNGCSHVNMDIPFNNNGGAIKINHNTKLTVENCKFINNSSDDFGGAIYNCGELTILESTFNENIASYAGGAIYNRGILTISESTLKKNISQVFGGGICNGGVIMTSHNDYLRRDIFAKYYSGELTITGSTLNSNTAGINGGAIFNCNGTCNIVASTLNGNIIKRIEKYAYGGAIFNNCVLNINESSLKKNRAFRGGAIFNNRKYNGHLEAINCTFKFNIPNGIYEGNRDLSFL